MATYQSFIGLEVHIHLLTKAKAFCSCRSAYGDEPNANVCPGCLAYPGVLPVLNLEALYMGALLAKALFCTVPKETWFERKQYFYPDLSKNYQMTQFASPIGQKGYLDIMGRGKSGPIKKRIRIKECHIEEDAGKMIHSGTASLLDYNRAGMALMEIVTEPDLETGEEAELFLQQLRRLVRYLGVCDGNMEEGSLRADANISINLPGKGLGKRVEIKNLNSSRFVRLGVEYEIIRHSEMLDAGKTIKQETRLWNENRDHTEPMRTKEDAQDYRYMQDPDLPLYIIGDDYIKAVESALVELPLERMKRIMEGYGLSDEQSDFICDEKALADYFEEAVKEAVALGMNKEAAALGIYNWLHTDVKGIFNREGLSMADIKNVKLLPRRLAMLVVMTGQGKVSIKNAKQTLTLVLKEDRDAELIIKEKGWEQLSDPVKIAEVVKSVYTAEEAVFNEIRQAIAEKNQKRQQTLTAFLTGKVLAATGGRADPKIAGAQIEELISSGQNK